jgi:hypothetical protein
MNLTTAFFVSMPFQFRDLLSLHLAGQRKPYVIEATVQLAKIDFENFITDLCVDRRFIEENTGLCRVDENGVWHCIFVHQKGRKDGVLVMPEGQGFPKWAAYIPDENIPI